MIPEQLIGGVSTCRELVQSAFNLGDFEMQVYVALSRQGPLRADELGKAMGKDRSTVYRALQKLMSCGLVYRETKSIERGGYFHIYRTISKEMLLKRLEQCVEDLHKRMRQTLVHFAEKFDENMAASIDKQKV
jgi:predicted transcriptional regulator